MARSIGGSRNYHILSLTLDIIYGVKRRARLSRLLRTLDNMIYDVAGSARASLC